jgi:hypothetical protein
VFADQRLRSVWQVRLGSLQRYDRQVKKVKQKTFNQDNDAMNGGKDNMSKLPNDEHEGAEQRKNDKADFTGLTDKDKKSLQNAIDTFTRRKGKDDRR